MPVPQLVVVGPRYTANVAFDDETIGFDRSALPSLPESLGRLPSLRRINLTGCRELTALPALDKLSGLKEVVLDGCFGLKQKNPLGFYVLRAKVRARLPPQLRWDYSE